MLYISDLRPVRRVRTIEICKDNQMRSPSLLSGSKIHKAHFEASNPKMLLQSPPLKSDSIGGLCTY